MDSGEARQTIKPRQRVLSQFQKWKKDVIRRSIFRSTVRAQSVTPGSLAAGDVGCFSVMIHCIS